MKNQDTLNRFIQLRAEGWTFGRIADDLGVPKSTLVLWSRKHQHQIRNLQALELESVANQTFHSRRQRWEKLAHDLKRLEAELDSRSLEDIPTARLVTLVADLRARTAKETDRVEFVHPNTEVPPDELRRHRTAHSWEI